MFRVTITTRGTSPRQFIEKLNAKILDIEAGIIELGDETTTHIRDVITSSKKRESEIHNDKFHRYTRDNLSKSMESKISSRGTLFGVGIGYIPDLQKFAPYWRVVNDGGYVPPAVKGFFSDGSGPVGSMRGGGGTQAFYQSKGGQLMIPKSPIRPMNYIQTTNNWLKSYWATFWSSRLRKTVV